MPAFPAAFEDWTRRATYTVDHTKVLAGIPFVSIPLSNFDDDWWAAVTDGEDLRATLADGETAVPCFPLLSTIDTMAKTGALIVRTDGISTSVDLDIVVYTGNAGASIEASGATNGRNAVFAGFASAHILNSLTDLTGNGCDFTAYGSPTSGVATPIEGVTGYSFAGSSDYLMTSVAPVSALPVTIQTHFNPAVDNAGMLVVGVSSAASSNANQMLIYAKGDAGGDPIRVSMQGNGGGPSIANSTTDFAPSTWYYASGSRTTATSGVTTAYVNGVSETTNSTNIAAMSGLDRLTVGRRTQATPDSYYNGTASFVFVSASALSANTIATMKAMWADGAFGAAAASEENTGGGVVEGNTGWVPFLVCVTSTLSGAVDWSNPTYALVNDANGATANIPDTELSEYLRFTSPDFAEAVPVGASEYTVYFRFTRLGQSNSGRRVYDENVQAIVGGTITGTNLAITGTHWTGSATITYGPGWGITFAGDNFDSDFGFAIRCDGGTGNPNVLATVYYAECYIEWPGDEPAVDVTGTAAAGLTLEAAALGARGSVGTAAAAIDVDGAALGYRGVMATATAALDAAATATGFRGVFGTAAAALELAASTVALRGVFGVASAAFQMLGTALGFRSAYGTATADLTIDATATDYSGEQIGTAAADLSIGGRAIGYVGTLGPADGRALMPYYTGAEATGAPQRDPALSIDGYRSGVRFPSMEWDTDDPLIGLSIVSVGGGNGLGIGSLTAATAGSVTWTAPGGSAGAAVALAEGDEATLGSLDSGAWVRVRRRTAVPLEGAKTIQCVDVYNNLFSDVQTSDAVSGLVDARALMIRNEAGAVIAFRAWVGDCDDAIAIALEAPVAGALDGSGLTWSTASTAETGPSVAVVSAGQEIGLHVRRSLAADTAPSGSQLWEVRFDWSDGVDVYETAVRGRYRIERTDYVQEGIWIGVGEQPNFDAAPDETWTTRPHTTSLGLSVPATVYMARRKRNKWGLWGVPTDVQRYDLDGDGTAVRLAPSAPTELSAGQTSGNLATVGGLYDADADGANRAALWVIWLASDGSTPDGSGTPDGYMAVQNTAAIDDLAWISEGPALMDGAPLEALVRLRRLDGVDGATPFSPDVIQLSDSGAGILKVDAAISDWPSDGYAKIETRFGRLLEVIHYSGIAVSAGQTTVTVDARALMGTTATATTALLIVTPCVAVDSENTDTAHWDVVAVAPGRPTGALIYGTSGAQAQAPVTGPDGATPQVLEAGENVHLVLGEGWSSLYIDTTLVWRCLYHGEGGEANALYIPSEWTLVASAVSGAAVAEGVVDVVDGDTIYIVVNGQRRLLIDVGAMEITVGTVAAEATMPVRAEQEATLEQFGATLFMVWDPEREDWRPYAELTAAGVLNVGLVIEQGLDASEVVALWGS